MQQEFRWEFVEIGQGHYHSDLCECMKEAVHEARKKMHHTIKIEIFRPRREVIGFLKDGEFLTPNRKIWKSWFFRIRT